MRRWRNDDDDDEDDDDDDVDDDEVHTFSKRLPKKLWMLLELAHSFVVARSSQRSIDAANFSGWEKPRRCAKQKRMRNTLSTSTMVAFSSTL